MTKEDAVAIVSEIRSDYNFFDKNEETEYRALSMAIEALQAQATLDDVSNAYENGYQQGKFEAQQWIPVSERLPSAEHNLKGFLTTVRWYEYEAQGDYEYYETSDVFVLVYENGKFGHWDGEKLIPNDDVIAWMKMPEPYTEEEQ